MYGGQLAGRATCALAILGLDPVIRAELHAIVRDDPQQRGAKALVQREDPSLLHCLGEGMEHVAVRPRGTDGLAHADQIQRVHNIGSPHARNCTAQRALRHVGHRRVDRELDGLVGAVANAVGNVSCPQAPDSLLRNDHVYRLQNVGARARRRNVAKAYFQRRHDGLCNTARGEARDEVAPAGDGPLFFHHIRLLRVVGQIHRTGGGALLLVSCAEGAKHNQRGQQLGSVRPDPATQTVPKIQRALRLPRLQSRRVPSRAYPASSQAVLQFRTGGAGAIHGLLRRGVHGERRACPSEPSQHCPRLP
eukprot:scaffold3759_cov425-Prasinococcus_capsulatus_cf.AAC.2